MNKTIIRTENLTKYYNKGMANEVLAVHSVSVGIERGDFAVLKGPSGSGKTTLLSLVGCMTRPTSGSITVEERDISHFPERFLTDIRRKTFGFIFQQFHLIQGMSVLQNVMVPLFPTDIDITLLKKRAADILEGLGMSKRKDFPVQGLSGGEQQRTAIARALINDPEVVLADEPTAHLDTALSQDYMGVMKELWDRGKTVIIASHDPLVFDNEYVTLTVEMRDGMVKSISRR
ncbi:Phosphonate-transporting ATPase [Candidatus Sulfobium mesophilum]|uniref:Phosphonate-transporting ATPase n=1 Tax=Candidatus Sulfobium mesophilum TaxID=2016548 RepID=A0A2U3QIE1_9BACT|nr:Phosphonate-transporting ATPase [Candidatus Sulfobium mesophilum]